MSFINHNSMEVNCKLVYFGPAGSGKTTNLSYIYSQKCTEGETEFLPSGSETEPTLFFDFLPLGLGKTKGFNVRFHLYTIPGQIQYDSVRKLVLRGVDGLVFVGDSQVSQMEKNRESLAYLVESLDEHGYEIKKIPLVFQYNKQDVFSACPVEEMSKALNTFGALEFPAVATKGEGVLETLNALTKAVVDDLKGL